MTSFQKYDIFVKFWLSSLMDVVKPDLNFQAVSFGRPDVTESSKGTFGFARAGLDVVLCAIFTAYEASEIAKSAMHSSASPSMVTSVGYSCKSLCWKLLLQ